MEFINESTGEKMPFEALLDFIECTGGLEALINRLPKGCCLTFDANGQEVWVMRPQNPDRIALPEVPTQH